MLAKMQKTGNTIQMIVENDVIGIKFSNDKISTEFQTKINSIIDRNRYLKKKRVIDFISFYSSIKKNEEQPNDTNEIRKALFNEVLSDSNQAFREAKNISSRLRRFQKQMSVNSQ